MLLLSFFRKKTTRIYFVLFFSFFLLCEILMIGKHNYYEKANTDYQGSYVYVKTDREVDFTKYSDIKNVYETILLRDDIFIMKDSDLNRNEILVPKSLIKDVALKTNFSLYTTDDSVFFVKGYSDIVINAKILSVSQTVYNGFTMNKKLSYFLTFTDWLGNKDTIKAIETECHTEVIPVISKKDRVDYESIINLFANFITLFFVLIFGLGVLFIFNIIHDEKKNTFLYRTIGYSKNKTVFLLVIKMILLILISFVLSIPVSFLFQYVMK